MRKILLFLFICFYGICDAQPLTDSLAKKYNATDDVVKKRVIIENYLYYTYKKVETDKALMRKLTQQCDYFRKHKMEIGINATKIYIANIFRFSGDYSTALKYGIEVQKYYESTKDTAAFVGALTFIGATFSDSKDYKQAEHYYKKAIAFSKKFNDGGRTYSGALNDLSDAYVKANQPDLALSHIQEALEIATKNKDTLAIYFFMGTQGQVYLAKKQFDIAKSIFDLSSKYATTYKDDYVLAYNSDDISNIWFQKKQLDSSLAYARKALAYGKDISSLELRVHERMYQIFEKKDISDSVYKYYRITMNEKDRMFSVEKTRELQSLGFREQVRQQEIEEAKRKLEEERKENIQYALIGLGLVSLLIVYILLSRRFIANPKIIRFFGVVALLLIFEFLNLILHPFLGHLTHHSPLLMLLALSGLAALLVPLHHKIEHWAIHKLIEKNKEIRLTLAKKTVEELENE